MLTAGAIVLITVAWWLTFISAVCRAAASGALASRAPVVITERGTAARPNPPPSWRPT